MFPLSKKKGEKEAIVLKVVHFNLIAVQTFEKEAIALNTICLLLKFYSHADFKQIRRYHKNMFTICNEL